MRYHYVYRIDCGSSYYIGVRSSVKPPEQDRYMGSGMWCFCGIKYHPLVKIILSTHENREAAEREELRLLLKHINQNGCMNRRRSNQFKYADV